MYGVEKVWFREARHVEDIEGTSLEVEDENDWRKIRERMKTVSVALVLCLNLGVDPPDIEKPNQCARKQAWINPNISNPTKSAQKIATNLQKIYERLQPRARYKHVVDPTVDIVKKLCTSLRKNAKDERVLFHFNGHGVPKPTDAGEIWVFNKNITQYIPLSLYDLQTWMGVPSVYLWDCSFAGTLVNKFMVLAEDHSLKWTEEYRNYQGENYPSPILEEDQYGNNKNVLNTMSMPSFKDSIQLGACAAGENLPFNPDLPADLFTCCLTTPIQTSLLCHMLKTGTKNRFPPNIIDEIPGVSTDRRTLLGELNWIFAAITDTIAWSSLPMETFQKLFRQDLLIASLFRSFLLAERIMFENGCHVVSQPQLPSVYSHPFWEYWDHTLDLCLSNMHTLMADKGNIVQLGHNNWFVSTSLKHNLMIELPLLNAAEAEYTFSTFFIDQLQAFEVWLMFGINKTSPPQQLPVLLQVLLSQTHRVRALELLARFVDLGSWAVVAALSVGIFPYVLKLLQCCTKELRPALAFIWAKILSIDPINQNELLKDNGYVYFTNILKDPEVEPRFKIVSAFVMAMLIYNKYRPAQEKLVQSDYVNECVNILSDSNATKCRMLCMWLLIGLGRLWVEYDEARWLAVRNVTYERVEEFLNDDVPEVRSAAVYALGCFIHNRSRNNEHATTIDNEVCDKLCQKCSYDGSVLVRAELAAAIQWFLIDFESRFLDLYIELDKKIEKNLMFSICKNNLHNKTNEAKVEPQSINGFKIKRSSSFFTSTKKQKKEVEHKKSLRMDQPNSTVLVKLTKDVKLRLYKQMRFLETKNFKDPFERIWLSLLRLCFDPFEQVSNMCMKLINHIINLSEKKKLERLVTQKNNIALEIAVSNEKFSLENNSVRFMIGSPGVLSDSTNVSQTNPPSRKNSSLKTSQKICECASLADMVSNGMIETSSTNFTPKRNMFGSQHSRYNKMFNSASSDDDSPTGNSLNVNGIVSTKFIEWCSKTFTQPIYKTIYEEASTSTRNSFVDSSISFTVANPTDWALHTHEGLKQKAAREIELLKSENVGFSLFFQYKTEAIITSIAWSFLRPYVYVCDGANVSLYNTNANDFDQYGMLKPSCSFLAYDAKYIEDSISDLMVANELTHELLITGTKNGLIEVWDPMFCEHSHEIQAKSKLITAAYLLNDLPRITTHKKQNHTLYRWDQSCGKIACSGNVRVCRLWDAWAEKSVLDLALHNKNHFATCISMDLNCSLISCGFVDGSFNVYDVRLPSEQSKIMSSRDFSSPVINSEILLNSRRLVVGSRDGDIRVWEPRMFCEPIFEFNAIENLNVKKNNNRYDSNVSMQLIDVHKTSELIACALSNSTIRLFDLSGSKCFSQFNYTSQSTTSNLSKLSSQSNQSSTFAEPLAMKFHHGQLLLGVSFVDRSICAYGFSS